MNKDISTQSAAPEAKKRSEKTIASAKAVARRTLDFFLPKKCALCDGVMLLFDESELCPDCLAVYTERLEEKCPVCRLKARDCLCSYNRARNLGTKLSTLGFYKDPKDPVGKLVYTFKHRRLRDLTRFFSRSLAAELMRNGGPAIKDVLVVYPPRSASGLKKYGFDHSYYLAKETARYLGAAFCPALERTSGTEQKKLDSEQRRKNAIGAFRVSPKYADDIRGRRIILIDDVATTGATLAGAAETLLAAGAADVSFASLFITAEKPISEREGIWFEQDDDTEIPEDDFDPFEDDVGF